MPRGNAESRTGSLPNTRPAEEGLSLPVFRAQVSELAPRSHEQRLELLLQLRHALRRAALRQPEYEPALTCVCSVPGGNRRERVLRRLIQPGRYPLLDE